MQFQWIEAGLWMTKPYLSQFYERAIFFLLHQLQVGCPLQSPYFFTGSAPCLISQKNQCEAWNI